MRQRLYQIVGGLRGRQRCDRLRHDPTFQVVAADGRAALGSQPTLSRLENAIEWPAMQRLARTGVDWFCAYAYGPRRASGRPRADLDSTDDPTHGTQQLALFHGYYDQHMYHPLIWFEGRTGLLLRTRLRPGRDRECGVRRGGSPPPAPAAAPAVSPHPDLPARRRGHGHAGGRSEIGSRRDPLRAGHRHQSRLQSPRAPDSSPRRRPGTIARGRPVHLRTSFRHRAKSWPHPRRILVKIDVTAAGPQRALHGHEPPRPRCRSHRVVRRSRRVGELDQRTQTGHPRRPPQLSSVLRERVPTATPQHRAAAARLLPTRCPRGNALRDGDHRDDPPPAAQSRGPRRAGVCAGCGFISRPIGRANRSSPRVIARWPARPT